MIIFDTVGLVHTPASLSRAKFDEAEKEEAFWTNLADKVAGIKKGPNKNEWGERKKRSCFAVRPR